jgi:predicted nuclease of predicted toxin-antitoxin system
VKLPFDHNLSHRLVDMLREAYPDSVHVRDVGLDRALDKEIWEFAGTYGFIIVSKDSDFHQRSLVESFPPKVIWVARGNCSTADVAGLLRSRVPELAAFESDRDAAFLELD